jgi:hypothetical protein
MERTKFRIDNDRRIYNTGIKGMCLADQLRGLLGEMQAANEVQYGYISSKIDYLLMGSAIAMDKPIFRILPTHIKDGDVIEVADEMIEEIFKEWLEADNSGEEEED